MKKKRGVFKNKNFEEFLHGCYRVDLEVRPPEFESCPAGDPASVIQPPFGQSSPVCKVGTVSIYLRDWPGELVN